MSNVSDPLFTLRERPLSVNVINDEILSINIGIDVLADAVQRFEPFNVYDENKGAWRDAWIISDKLEFAKDIVRQLTDESEIGSTILTDLLDEAAEKALDYGSLGVVEGEPAWPEPIEEDEKEEPNAD